MITFLSHILFSSFLLENLLVLLCYIPFRFIYIKKYSPYLQSTPWKVQKLQVNEIMGVFQNGWQCVSFGCICVVLVLMLVHPGEGNGTPLQYSCLENPMDGGTWWAAVHGVAKSQTWLRDFTFTFHFHALEKEMATHSSGLAWRIPGTGEPGGLLSMGSHRVGHDWSDLAAAVGTPRKPS